MLVMLLVHGLVHQLEVRWLMEDNAEVSSGEFVNSRDN